MRICNIQRTKKKYQAVFQAKADLSAKSAQSSQITVDTFFHYLYHSPQLALFDILWSADDYGWRNNATDCEKPLFRVRTSASSAPH